LMLSNSYGSRSYSVSVLVSPPPVVSYDSITVGTVGVVRKMRSASLDTSFVVTYLFQIDRITTGSATILVTPKPFTIQVPEGLLHMSFAIPDSIRIQKIGIIRP